MAASISARFFKNKSTNLLIHHCYIKPKFWKILAKVMNVFFVKKLDNIFYVSKATERSIKKNISTFKKNKNSTVIYNGIKLNKPILNSSKKFFNQKINLKKIGMLARVDESKGQEDLIDAFSKLDKQVQKKYIIYLIGNGKIKYLNKLKLKVKEFGISKSFKFQNYINDRSENILSHLNLFFSLSRDFEGFGYSAVEAAAVGTPVIVTNVGATKEIFSSNNAAIIQPRNLKQIKNLLENFNKNTKVFEKKAKKAKLHILKNFNAEIMSKKFYKKLYK